MVEAFIAILALYATIVSTIVLVYVVYEPRLFSTAKLSIGMTALPVNTVEPTVQLEFVNKGKQPIVINSFGWRLPSGRRVFSTRTLNLTDLPKKLSDGDSITAVFDCSVVASELVHHGCGSADVVRLSGFFGDTEGRMYTTRKISFDLDYWAHQSAVNESPTYAVVEAVAQPG